MPTQRKTKNLGLNRSKDREKIFQYIENILRIKEKTCSRGNSKNKKINFEHTGRNPQPIRNFNLLNAIINLNGEAIIKSKDGLQSNCKDCERKFRNLRTLRSKNKYEKMSPEEIYSHYKKNWGEFKGCSICDPGKKKIRPEEVPISRGMETGLHNTCKKCSKSYSESVGGRWIIYSVDGHQVLKITDKDSCKTCGSKKNLHKDHIFPVSKGGTDNKENLQVLCRTHNLSKSDTIISPAIKNLKDIKNKMVCERYWSTLEKARKEKWLIIKFESEITKEVKEFILWKKNLSDVELSIFFENEKARNNRKHSIPHAVKKFREYCETAILEINEFLTKKN